MNDEIVLDYGEGYYKYRLTYNIIKDVFNNRYIINSSYYFTNRKSNIYKMYAYGSYIKINNQYSSGKGNEQLIDIPYNQELLMETYSTTISADDIENNTLFFGCGEWNYEGKPFDNIPNTSVIIEKLSSAQLKKNNVWKDVCIWFKLNTIWKRCIIWKKINGIWKKGS